MDSIGTHGDFVTLMVPTIKPDLDGFGKAVQIQNRCEYYRLNGIKKINFSFKSCGNISLEALTFLAATARDLEHNNVSVSFDFSATKANVGKLLANTGFSMAFGAAEVLQDKKNVVSFRQDLDEKNHDQVLDHLKIEWLRPEWIKLSDKLANAFLGRVWEIYANVFTHSESKVGVITCGRYFPRLDRLSLSLTDLGMGIPRRIRNHRPGVNMTDADCMRWAMTDGNTTAGSADIARGLGFGLIVEPVA